MGDRVEGVWEVGEKHLSGGRCEQGWNQGPPERWTTVEWKGGLRGDLMIRVSGYRWNLSER